MTPAGKTKRYGLAAVILAVAIIGVAALYPGLTPSNAGNSATTSSQDQGQTQTQQVISTSTASGQQLTGGTSALLLVQLTDPPIVPAGTTSLNLTYSAIDLIVSEPGQNNTVTTNDVTVTPQGGSATVDLLQLQNVSQTIATATIPANSTVYSFGFAVTGITIAMNGTSPPSNVTLATGGSTFQVALAGPVTIGGTSAALLQLNPIIVNTPTGYQMIPSAVAVVNGGSHLSSQDKVVGSRHQLTSQDNSELRGAKGQTSSRLVALSSNGTSTTLTVEVNDTGSGPIRLTAIGLHGSFVQSGATGCPTPSTNSTSSSSTNSTSTTSSSTNSTNMDSSYGEQASGHDNSGSSRTTYSRTSYNPIGDQACGSSHENGWNELVFVPVTQGTTTTSSSSTESGGSNSTTTSTSTSTSSSTSAGTCSTVSMALPHEGDSVGEGDHGGLTLAPGECVILTFTGTITFGGIDQFHSGMTVVPDTAAGQAYTLHIVASGGAETSLNCALPPTATSCAPANPHND